MIENMSDIQNGMDVFGSDGQKIGTVDEVYGGGGSGTTRRAGSGPGLRGR